MGYLSVSERIHHGERDLIGNLTEECKIIYPMALDAGRALLAEEPERAHYFNDSMSAYSAET